MSKNIFIKKLQKKKKKISAKIARVTFVHNVPIGIAQLCSQIAKNKEADGL